MINIQLNSGVQNARQRFSQRIDRRLFRFEVDRVSYCANPYWVMNVYINGEPRKMGCPLLPGAVHDFGDDGRLVFVGEEATLDNLGKANKLVWIPAE